MPVALETEDGLRRHAIMVVAKKIGLDILCAEQKSTHELGIMNSLEFFFMQRKTPQEG